MGINFPTAPAIGTLHPNPALAGVPQYTWDGEKWTSGTGSGAIYISDTAPAAPAGSLWWESDTGILYVRYYDGSSTQWVAIAGSPQDAVLYGSAQALSEAQKAQARTNVYAAPLDALAYSGMQINGSMEVSQELGETPITTSRYVVDGWVLSHNLPTGRLSVNQQPLGPTECPGLTKCIQINVTTAQATIGPNVATRFTQQIEGYRLARAAWGTTAASPITVGFWVRASAAGTYRAVVYNFDGSALTPWAPFTINAAGGTFQWVTITFPGQTTGTWKTDNSIGATLAFDMASDSTPNIFAVAGGYASLTGVVVLPGIEAPSAARSALIMRPYDQELVTCQRYWEKTYPEDTAPGFAYGYNGGAPLTTTVYATFTFCQLPPWQFKVVKRANPTTTIYSPWTGASGVCRAETGGDVAVIGGANSRHYVGSANNVSVVGINALYYHAVADIRL